MENMTGLRNTSEKNDHARKLTDISTSCSKDPNQTSIPSVVVLPGEHFHQDFNGSATPTSACSPFGCCGPTATTHLRGAFHRRSRLLVRRDGSLVLDLGFHVVDRVKQVLGILNPCGWVTIPSPLQTTDKNLE